jgi:preprotein translocase subunit SecD
MVSGGDDVITVEVRSFDRPFPSASTLNPVSSPRPQHARFRGIPIVVAAASLLVVLPLTLGCSTGTTATSSTASTAGSNNYPVGPMWVATFRPAHQASSDQLQREVTVMQRRLRTAGVSDFQVEISRGDLVIDIPKDSTTNRNAILDTVSSSANLLFRPVLCAVPSFTRPSSGSITTTPLPTACPAIYQLTAANLNVITSTGQPQDNVPPWSGLADQPDTAPIEDVPSQTVLLSAGSRSGYSGERLLLGPAEATNANIASAAAAFNSPDWDVNLTLTSSGSTAWDMLAQQQFHAFIGIDLDGTVLSAPLTLPNQPSFTSFGGKVQVWGGFTQAQADNLANDLESGPLPVPLVILSVSTS